MKHLYKITILFLLAFVLPIIMHAQTLSSSHSQMNRIRENTHFLSGEIYIRTEVGEPMLIDDFRDWFNIEVSYSGNEDVTMIVIIDGVVVDSVHSNEWTIQDYHPFEPLYHIIEVDVIANGYYDLHDYLAFRGTWHASSFDYYLLLEHESDEVNNCYIQGDTLTYKYGLRSRRKLTTSNDYWSFYVWEEGIRAYSGDIIIPSSVCVIGNYAFNAYTGLLNYRLPSSYESGSMFFPYISPNTAVLEVPKTIKFIERNAFGNDPSNEGLPYTFSNVIIEDLESWCAIDFKGPRCNPLLYASYFTIDNQRVNNLVIPETLPALRSYAFAGCPGVNSVVLPISVIYGRQVFLGSSVQSLILTGDGAFQEGSLDMNAVNVYIGNGVTDISGIKVKPTDVYSYSNTPPICDENTFTDYSGTLHVPASALAAYFTAPYWSNFINIVGDVIEPKSVSINNDTISMRPGMTHELVASIMPTDATGTIVWNSTNSNVAIVENGQVSAIASGECDIIANCVGKQAVCHVIVAEVLPTSIMLSQETALMETGSQLTLTATVLPDSTTNKTVEWSSSDANIATVENGAVTAVKAGECDIIARCQDVQAVCHVTVVGVLPTAITIDQENALMKLGSVLALSASVLPDSASYKIVTWSSSDENIAIVNNGIVTAVGTGMCDIVAQCRDLQAVCHVTVAQLALDQHEAQLLPNHILTLEPVVSSVIGNLNVSSSDPSVAAVRMVNGTVQVVGIKEGYATIIVNWVNNDVFSDSCLVEVYTERGDVNCDGFVNISDVTTLIDVLLGGETPHSDENADCNTDNRITISDVTALIDALLSGEPLPDKDSQVYNVNGVSFKMVKVKGGTFMMGATAGQGDQSYDDEFPVHEVILSSYSIGETEVTQALWQAVMGENPSNFKGDLNRPVEMVSWYDCQTFITQLN